MTNEPAVSIQVLLDESRLAAELSERRFALVGQFGAVAIVIFAATSGITDSVGRSMLAVVAPPVLTIIALMMIQASADQWAMNYYQGRIQERLNSYLPDLDRLRFESVVMGRRYWSASFVWLLLGLLLTVAYIVSFLSALHAPNYQSWIMTCYVVSTLIGICGLIAGGRDLIRNENQARRIYETHVTQ